ncbi:hypothetical protein Q4543_23905 [Salipiger sp. 1_MG-2023]|nr:hypothetical protein [Salipiger sp. 1_MG-2023]MDO6588520.1 hypothetical protein [Salipiger sp. 1_MG-2023]
MARGSKIRAHHLAKVLAPDVFDHLPHPLDAGAVFPCLADVS